MRLKGFNSSVTFVLFAIFLLVALPLGTLQWKNSLTTERVDVYIHEVGRGVQPGSVKPLILIPSCYVWLSLEKIDNQMYREIIACFDYDYFRDRLQNEGAPIRLRAEIKRNERLGYLTVLRFIP